jgi:hypothetical protein
LPHKLAGAALLGRSLRLPSASMLSLSGAAVSMECFVPLSLVRVGTSASGKGSWAAVIHDYLYWEQPLDREKADEIFKLAMLDTKVDAPTVQIIYEAVRFGGGSAWTENGAAKAQGESRILKLFPSDPTTSWSDWKKKQGVFAP